MGMPSTCVRSPSDFTSSTPKTSMYDRNATTKIIKITVVPSAHLCNQVGALFINKSTATLPSLRWQYGNIVRAATPIASVTMSSYPETPGNELSKRRMIRSRPKPNTFAPVSRTMPRSKKPPNNAQVLINFSTKRRITDVLTQV